MVSSEASLHDLLLAASSIQDSCASPGTPISSSSEDTSEWIGSLLLASFSLIASLEARLPMQLQAEVLVSKPLHALLNPSHPSTLRLLFAHLLCPGSHSIMCLDAELSTSSCWTGITELRQDLD